MTPPLLPSLLLSLAWLLALVPTPAQASPLKGQRLKVTGRWDGHQLVIYKVKFRDSRKYPKQGQVSGIIEQIDATQKLIQIGPVKVHWHTRTRFNKLKVSDLAPGVAVKIKLRIDKNGEFIARQIGPGPENLEIDEIRLLGAVTAVQSLSNARLRIVILGVPGVVRERLSNPSLQLTRRQDDFRPDEQFTVELFGRPLIIGGEVGITPRYQKDFKLDPNENDDRLRLNTELQLELFYTPSKMVAIFLEAQAAGQMELYREGGRDKSVERRLRRGETWLFWGDLFDSGVSVQIGRQNFQDRREWWWDANLDAFRIYFLRPFIHFELSAGQEAAILSTDQDGIEAAQDDVLRILSRTRW